MEGRTGRLLSADDSPTAGPRQYDRLHIVHNLLVMLGAKGVVVEISESEMEMVAGVLVEFRGVATIGSAGSFDRAR